MHFLQSSAWKKFKTKQGYATVSNSATDWSYLAILESSFLGIKRLYCPYGPTAKTAEDFMEAIKSLTKEARDQGATYMRVEPMVPGLSEEMLKKSGFLAAHKNIQPKNTIINTLDHTDIVENLHRRLRRLWRKNQRAGVTFSESYEPNDISHFISMMNSVSERTGMNPHPDQYFKDLAQSLFPSEDAGLLFAEQDGNKLAAILFFKDTDTMYYAHAASYSQYRSLSPATALAVHSLVYAQSIGCAYFDFFGVAPESADESHPWAGFTEFKLSFGGQRKNYLGTWELPLHPIRFWLYKVALYLSRVRP